MKTVQPPRLATWLLQRMTSGPRRESLIGDLFEQYRDRPSALWYWRQAITAKYGMIGLMFALSPDHPTMSRAALLLPAVLVISRPLSILAGGLLSVPEGGSLREVPRRI